MLSLWTKEHRYKEHHSEPIRLPEPSAIVAPTPAIEHDLEAYTPAEQRRVMEEISLLSLTDGYLE